MMYLFKLLIYINNLGLIVINHMDIKGRILQSLRPRRDGLLLRSDVSSFGGST